MDTYKLDCVFDIIDDCMKQAAKLLKEKGYPVSIDVRMRKAESTKVDLEITVTDI